MDYTAHGILQARILEWVVIPSSRVNPSQPRVEPRSPALQVDSLPAEPGKPKECREVCATIFCFVLYGPLLPEISSVTSQLLWSL